MFETSPVLRPARSEVSPSQFQAEIMRYSFRKHLKIPEMYAGSKRQTSCSRCGRLGVGHGRPRSLPVPVSLGPTRSPGRVGGRRRRSHAATDSEPRSDASGPLALALAALAACQPGLSASCDLKHRDPDAQATRAACRASQPAASPPARRAAPPLPPSLPPSFPRPPPPRPLAPSPRSAHRWSGVDPEAEPSTARGTKIAPPSVPPRSPSQRPAPPCCTPTAAPRPPAPRRRPGAARRGPCRGRQPLRRGED